MFQVTCTHDRTLVRAHLGQAAVRLRLLITLGTLRTAIMLTLLILSVPIKEEKATKVGMPPAPLNLASKALISKSGPPHDHFNWLVVEKCAEWLGLAHGLFLTLYSEQLQTVDRKSAALWFETFLVVSCHYCALGIPFRNLWFKELCAT